MAEEIQIEIEECSHLKWDLDEIRKKDGTFNQLEFNLGPDRETDFELDQVPLSQSGKGILCGLTGEACSLLHGGGTVPTYMVSSKRCPAFEKVIRRYKLQGFEKDEIFYAKEITREQGEQ